MAIKTKAQRITAEEKRIHKLFENLPESKKSLADGLVKRAAYMRVTLEDYEADLDSGGYVEHFCQSEKLDPYERVRPVAQLYNTMNKNYQSIVKQLSDMLPEEAVDPAQDLLEFVSGAG